MGMRLVITGGGTGGHLFPGIALAEGMLQRFPQGAVMFIGTDRHLDNQALANKPFQVVALASRALKGKSLLGQIAALVRVPVSIVAAMRMLRQFKPDLVFGVGGYVTGPVLAAARLLGIPTAIHEQNSIPGLANRMLGRIVDRVFVSLPGSERFFPATKVRLSGNPVRRELLARAQESATPHERLTVLVLGGSQGAQAVNRLMVDAVGQLAEKNRINIVHQTGISDAEWVRAGYNAAAVAARVEPFISDMATVYGEADLIVSRAGATTLAEITVFGRPAILVPYPYAADDHQRHNARYLAEQGAAVMADQAELNAAKLAGMLAELLADEGQRRQMAARAKALGRPQATETIINDCLALAGA